RLQGRNPEWTHELLNRSFADLVHALPLPAHWPLKADEAGIVRGQVARNRAGPRSAGPFDRRRRRYCSGTAPSWDQVDWSPALSGCWYNLPWLAAEPEGRERYGSKHLRGNGWSPVSGPFFPRPVPQGGRRIREVGPAPA